MTHARETIVDAVVNAVTGLSTTGGNVYKGRALPVVAANSLAVYARSESVDYEQGQIDSIPMRIIDLHVVGYSDDPSDLEATLDTIAEEVEAALYADATLNSYLSGLELGDTEVEVEADNDGRHGSIDLNFSLYYRAAEGAPGTLLT